MNKLIKELAKHSGAVEIHKMMTGVNQYTFLEMDLEKFAELIVKECCDWIDNSPTTGGGQLILTKQFIIDNLNGYFGIK